MSLSALPYRRHHHQYRRYHIFTSIAIWIQVIPYVDKSIDLNQQAEFVDSSSLPVAAMVKTKAKASKKCSMPHCMNDAASTRAKFCTACFKKNASLASSKRKVFGGGGGVLGNRGKRSVVRRSAKRALVACKPCQSTPGHCPTVGIGSWNIESLS